MEIPTHRPSEIPSDLRKSFLRKFATYLLQCILERRERPRGEHGIEGGVFCINYLIDTLQSPCVFFSRASFELSMEVDRLLWMAKIIYTLISQNSEGCHKTIFIGRFIFSFIFKSQRTFGATPSWKREWLSTCFSFVRVCLCVFSWGS